MCELAHFAGHHRETAPVFAGARGLDRGVQRQQIGARGDLGDDLDETGDALRFFLQGGHVGGRLPGVAARAADALQALVDFGPSRHAFAAHLGCDLGRALGIGGDAFGGARHLLGTDDHLAGGLHVLLDLLLDRVDEVGRLGRADHDVVDRMADHPDELAAVLSLVALGREAEHQHAGERRKQRGRHWPERAGDDEVDQENEEGAGCGGDGGGDRQPCLARLKICHLSPWQMRYRAASGMSAYLCDEFYLIGNFVVFLTSSITAYVWVSRTPFWSRVLPRNSR